MNSEAALILRHWRDAVPDDRLAHLIRDVARALERSLRGVLRQPDVPGPDG